MPRHTANERVQIERIGDRASAIGSQPRIKSGQHAQSGTIAGSNSGSVPIPMSRCGRIACPTARRSVHAPTAARGSRAANPPMRQRGKPCEGKTAGSISQPSSASTQPDARRSAKPAARQSARHRSACRCCGRQVVGCAHVARAARRGYRRRSPNGRRGATRAANEYITPWPSVITS